MPLQIQRVEAQIDVSPPTSGVPGGIAPGNPETLATGGDRALKERLRPIVIEILNEELQRLRRRQG